MECTDLTCDECGKPVDCEKVLMCPQGHREDLIFCSDQCLNNHIHQYHSKS